MSLQDVKTKILNFIETESYAPLVAEDLIASLKFKGLALKEFWLALEELEAAGQIVKTRYQTYGLPEKMGLVTGKLQMTSKGFGFVLAPKGSDKEDLFVSPVDLNGAMHNDLVIARVSTEGRGAKREGQIIRILHHANAKVVGTFVPNGDYAFVVPDDKRLGKDIYVLGKNFHGAKAKQKVVVELLAWPEQGRNPEGRVIEVLGTVGDVGLEIISIIKQNDLSLTFPPEVLAEAGKIPQGLKKKEVYARQDRRAWKIITVDGEDAKDLDDAVYVEKQGKNYFLGVYIADVSYYVKEGSALDKEALDRGTSVYLVDRVLPMLPEALSNGICSLNQGEDRLTLACEMVIEGKTGQILSYQLAPTIIRSCHRMTSTAVRQMLVEKDEAMRSKYADILPMVEAMEELCGVLKKKRRARGAIDFDLPEQKVLLDAEKKPTAIVPRERSIAEFIIEEFMLAANETVAGHMSKVEWPFIYRVHGLPEESKMNSLAKLLANFGVVLRVQEKMEPLALQKALTQMVGRPEEKLISTVALRSLKQAVYQTENLGHFGLAAEFYTHFTSPIRRYPDLIVHRLLHKWLENPLLKTAKAQELSFQLENIATHASTKERAAAEAERSTVELKEAEYMAGHIGEEYEGTVSGVTSFGMFVALANGVEGLVHISALTDDYYDYVEEEYALVGFHLHKRYRLGDALKVEVLQVNISEHQIDLLPAGESPEAKLRLKEQLALKNAGAKKQGGHGAYFSAQKGKSSKKKKSARDGHKASPGGSKKVGASKSAGKNKKAKGRKSSERAKY